MFHGIEMGSFFIMRRVFRGERRIFIKEAASNENAVSVRKVFSVREGFTVRDTFQRDFLFLMRYVFHERLFLLIERCYP